MRLTKSQLFALLALGIPIIAWLAWFLLAEMRSWLGLEPWSRDGIQVQLGALIVVALSALGPLVLGPSALLVAAPSSSWAKQVRFIGLNILGVVYLLTGGLFLVGALLEREPAALPIVACLPVAARIYYGLAQEVNFGATARRFLKRMTPWLVVLVVYLVFGLGTLAAAFGAKAIDVAAVTFVVAWLPFLPLVFLLSFAVNWFLRRRARRRGEKEVLFCIGFYANIAWAPMPQARADIEWNKMHRIPEGGQLVSAWVQRASPVFWLECVDTEGNQYTLLGNMPPTPWVQWMAGLFLRSSNRGPWGGRVTRGLRLFERTDCPWTSMADDRKRTWVASLGVPAAGVSPTVGWICPDCPAERLDLLDTEGRDILVYKRAPNGQELKWIAGVYFVFGKTPTLPSDTLDSPQLPASTGTPRPSTATHQ